MRLLGPENCQLPLSSEAEMNLFSKARKLNLLLWLLSLHHLLPLSLPEKKIELKKKSNFFQNCTVRVRHSDLAVWYCGDWRVGQSPMTT